MPKFNHQDDIYQRHQPRKSDKRKRHARGFNEDIQDNRAARINFKKYVQQLEEELYDEYEDEEE